MANYAPENSVWSAMSYKPPRGRCNQKLSVLSSCPCLRFMLHPVKAATSFECDGCGHHASFHTMDNPQEDAIVQRWAEQQKLQQQQQQIAATEAATAAGANKKRRRIADKPADDIEVLELVDDDDNEFVSGSIGTITAQRSRQKRAVKFQKPRALSSQPG